MQPVNESGRRPAGGWAGRPHTSWLKAWLKAWTQGWHLVWVGWGGDCIIIAVESVGEPGHKGRIGTAEKHECGDEDVAALQPLRWRVADSDSPPSILLEFHAALTKACQAPS